MSRDLVDGEGENQAVRSFLLQYSCDRPTTIGAMKDNLRRSGFDGHWPGWVALQPYGAHLTKAGAQLWLRHLFSLENK